MQQEQQEQDSDEGEDIVEESGTEATEDTESLVESSAASSSVHITPPDFLQPGGGASQAAMTQAQAQRSRADQLAATRGLSVTTSDKTSRRHSRMVGGGMGVAVGLPASPRPPPQQQQQQHAQLTPPEGGLPNPHSPAQATLANSPLRPT